MVPEYIRSVGLELHKLSDMHACASLICVSAAPAANFCLQLDPLAGWPNQLQELHDA
jgi:hypothetical protein